MGLGRARGLAVFSSPVARSPNPSPNPTPGVRVRVRARVRVRVGVELASGAQPYELHVLAHLG